MQGKVSAYLATLPVIELLQAPGTRPRHWEALEARMEVACSPHTQALTLEYLLDIGLRQYAAFVAELAVKAQEQLELDELLQVRLPAHARPAARCVWGPGDACGCGEACGAGVCRGRQSTGSSARCSMGRMGQACMGELQSCMHVASVREARAQVAYIVQHVDTLLRGMSWHRLLQSQMHDSPVGPCRACNLPGRPRTWSWRTRGASGSSRSTRT